MRTRSPVPTRSGCVPGNALLLKVSTLKSLIAIGSARAAPIGTFASCIISA